MFAGLQLPRRRHVYTYTFGPSPGQTSVDELKERRARAMTLALRHYRCMGFGPDTPPTNRKQKSAAMAFVHNMYKEQCVLGSVTTNNIIIAKSNECLPAEVKENVLSFLVGHKCVWTFSDPKSADEWFHWNEKDTRNSYILFRFEDGDIQF